MENNKALECCVGLAFLCVIGSDVFRFDSRKPENQGSGKTSDVGPDDEICQSVLLYLVHTHCSSQINKSSCYKAQLAPPIHH